MKLYAVETEARGRSPDKRCVLRQTKRRPLLDAFEPWLRAKLDLISQKTKLAEAIRYALSRRTGLIRFLDLPEAIIDRDIRTLYGINSSRNAVY